MSTPSITIAAANGRDGPICAPATGNSPSAASAIAWRTATTAPASSRSIPASSAPGPCSSPSPPSSRRKSRCRRAIQLNAPPRRRRRDIGARRRGNKNSMRRQRRTKVVATLGPASSDRAVIGRLFDAGADVFRINMSHTNHDKMRELVTTIRAVEADHNRPIGILVDLQGPKLRLGAFTDGAAEIDKGQDFILDSDAAPGRCQARAAAASGDFCRHKTRRRAVDRRRQAAPGRNRRQRATHHDARRSRRQNLEPQGRQPARHRRAARGAGAQGSSPISKRPSMPASTGLRCRSSSARKTSPRQRRSPAAAPR